MSRPIPTSILPQLGYLMRLLASPHDGEALGAARAVGRKLAGVGLNFHDLADYVEHPAVRPFAGQWPTTATPPPPPRARSRRAETWRPPVHVSLTAEERAEMLASLEAAIKNESLGGWGRYELRALVTRLERGEKLPTRRMLERAATIMATLRGHRG